MNYIVPISLKNNFSWWKANMCKKNFTQLTTRIKNKSTRINFVGGYFNETLIVRKIKAQRYAECKPCGKNGYDWASILLFKILRLVHPRKLSLKTSGVTLSHDRTFFFSWWTNGCLSHHLLFSLQISWAEIKNNPQQIKKYRKMQIKKIWSICSHREKMTKWRRS